MAHFYGTVEGGRGQASRLGHKNTGITTDTSSWAGKVHVRMWWDEQTGRDLVRIALSTSADGRGRDLTIYLGPVDPDDHEFVESIQLLATYAGPRSREALALVLTSSPP